MIRAMTAAVIATPVCAFVEWCGGASLPALPFAALLVWTLLAHVDGAR